MMVMANRLPRLEKRIRQMRGQGGAGYGGKKRHRGKGSQGGKGWAGSTKHKRSYVYKYALAHFGYKGFRPPQFRVEVALNLDDAEKLSNKIGKTELDLTELGYTKLLGRGKLTKPLAIKIARASASAKEAVESAGGKLLLGEPKGSPVQAKSQLRHVLEEIAEGKKAAEKKA